MEENQAAKAFAAAPAAGAAEENPARSQNTEPEDARREPAETDSAPKAEQPEGTEPDVTQTQAFARRLKEETGKWKPYADFVRELAQARGEDDPAAFMERERAALSEGLAADERERLEHERDEELGAMLEAGRDRAQALDAANRIMNEKGAALLSRRAAAREELESRVEELTRQVEELNAGNAAREAAETAARASTGSAASEAAGDREFYTSEEYDRLPQAKKDELFESGRVFQLMARWAK